MDGPWVGRRTHLLGTISLRKFSINHIVRRLLIRCLPDVTKRVGLSRSTTCRLMRTGGFSPSLKLATRTVGWHSTDIETWIASGTSERLTTRTDNQGRPHIIKSMDRSGLPKKASRQMQSGPRKWHCVARSEFFHGFYT
ncbi:MAG: helix-turn-helix transcriptional regulator [Candidatus Puniceispirillaceae bacterium]